MPMLTVVRPQPVEIYQCDNVHCDSECESPFPDMPGDNPWTAGTISEGCSWIAIPSIFRTKHDYRQAKSQFRDFSMSIPRYFCTFQCMSEWAQTQAREVGEFTDCEPVATEPVAA